MFVAISDFKFGVFISNSIDDIAYQNKDATKPSLR
jgi:hypothetical protein